MNTLPKMIEVKISKAYIRKGESQNDLFYNTSLFFFFIVDQTTDAVHSNTKQEVSKWPILQ